MIDRKKTRQDVIRAGKELIENGLIARTWGNISARVSETEFIITPSGRAYEDLEPDDLVVVHIPDETYMGDVKPSSEKGIHAVLYALHPEVNFIIHTHQNYSTALSIMGMNLVGYEKYDEKYGQILGRRIPCARYGLSSTKTLRDNVKNAAASAMDSKCVLMKNHGVVCFGADYDEAFKVAYTLEEMCKKRYGDLCGGYPTGEPEEYVPGKVTDFGEVFFKESDPDKAEIYEKTGANCIIHCKSPYIMKMSANTTEWRPYMDDQAQIAGTTIRTVPGLASPSQVVSALKGRHAVFLRDDGAYCIGTSQEDAEAVCMVLEKGCIAAYLASKVHGISPVGLISRKLERVVYMKKYSKLKDGE